MGRLSKDKRDVYYREAKSQGWRARSAFKLLQIDDEVDLFTGVRNVADLCAAPGGWSQVLAHRFLGVQLVAHEPPGVVRDDEDSDADDDCMVDVVQEGGATQEGVTVGVSPSVPSDRKTRIVAVDQYLMEPIEGVVQVQGDITSSATAQEVLSHFHGDLADLVVCDGAPDATGRPLFDEYVQHQLLLSAFHLAAALLAPGGTFVAKIFRGEHCGQVFAKLSRTYSTVLCCKPRASRNSSQEAFVVCRGYQPPADFDRIAFVYSVDRHEDMSYVGPKAPSLNVAFVSCGGGEGALDADTNYTVSLEHKIRGPVAPPVNAPYKEAIEARRGQKRGAEGPRP